jgi:hypothetical protein
MTTKICAIKGCDKRSASLGLCAAHRSRFDRKVSLAPPVREYNSVHGDTCTMQGCKKPYYARNYCVGHYYAVRRAAQKNVEVSQPHLEPSDDVVVIEERKRIVELYRDSPDRVGPISEEVNKQALRDGVRYFARREIVAGPWILDKN